MEVTSQQFVQVVVVCPASAWEQVCATLRNGGWRITSNTRYPIPGTGQFDMGRFRIVAALQTTADHQVVAANLKKELSK